MNSCSFTVSELLNKRTDSFSRTNEHDFLPRTIQQMDQIFLSRTNVLSDDEKKITGLIVFNSIKLILFDNLMLRITIFLIK